MRIRAVLLSNNKRRKNFPIAGKRTGGLQSSDQGIRLPATGRNYYKKPTQNYGRTFGWQHFDAP